MIHLNPDYVLAPFNHLIANCESNVLLGMRIVEKVENFPDATPDELQFMQLSMGGVSREFISNKNLFKKWIIKNGFEDIHTCIRTGLERFYVLKSVELLLAINNKLDIAKKEEELITLASKLYYDQLIQKVDEQFEKGLQFKRHIESFNNARNCLVHTNGMVTKRHCNNMDKDKLTILGNRFKLFYKNGDQEVPAEIGKPGPLGAGLMLGGEEFEIEFSIKDEIELSLKQFLDIMNTCVFFRADLDVELKKTVQR